MELLFQSFSSFDPAVSTDVVTVDVELDELLVSEPLADPVVTVFVVVAICLTRLHSIVTYMLCDGGMFTS